ncbi:Echinoderm microtubule-associated protein [Amphibalanus amphitrite]|uniref:Echinoderm microtubule-associated protein n=1 Tax=Amphibalanus amphitrite TaxID=1232801 RepID=A0A6A4X0G6_AMPAM|nr:Echinoderm microtubule-associated protein [Amphibalanus amphitrite]
MGHYSHGERHRSSTAYGVRDRHEYLDLETGDRGFKAPYGMKRSQPETGDMSPRKPRRHRVKPLSPVVKRVFGKTSPGSGPGSGSGSGSGSGKHGGRRSGDGCKIKIINNLDKSIQVKSFSQLRNDFYETDTFYLSNSEETTVRGSKVTREESRNSPPNDKKSGKILRRHNSEPLIQAKDKKSNLTRKRSESVNRYQSNSGTKGSGGGGGASDQVKVSLLGKVRTFYKASKDQPVQYLPPEKRLKLAWVYGYRGVDAHHNLWVLPSGELLYYVAAVAVLLNRHTDSQRHYTEHSEDIMCMDLHPSRHIVASGQRAGPGARSASVRVWGVERLDTLHVFGSRELQMGVAAVCFSVMNQGAYLLAIDDGDEHLLTVWTWHNEQILGKVATHQDHVYGAKFHPMDNNLIITFGKNHLTFWNKRRDGIFDSVDVFGMSSARTVLCVEFEPGGDLITGDSDGFITIWTIDNDGQYYKRVDFEAHMSAVTSLLMLSEVTLMSGGERDRRICAWDSSQGYVKRAETKLPDAAGGIRTLCPQRSGASDGNVYAGTTKNMILEGSIMRRFNTVVFGHSKNLWGLSACHDSDCFVTAGYDRLVVKWSDQHKVIWKAPLNSEAVSCAVHPLDTVVAVGGIDGHLTVFKLSDGSQVGSFRVCGQPLSCLCYSPGGDMLAVGAQTGSVYPYKVGRDGQVYVKFGPMQGSQPLTHLDWSTDGEYLQSVTIDHELVFCAWPELHYDRQQSVWTDSYADSRKARVLVSACRSRDHDLLAVGDSEGSVQLFRYPCPLNVQETAQCHSVKPQSSYVANIKFLRSGRQLVSVGGTDATVLQWRLQ